MFRIKTLAASGLVALALAALGASAPVASAKVCKAPEECYGVLLAPGSVIKVPDPDPTSIDNEGIVTFTGGTLVVSCPQAQLNGSIIVVKGSLEASITGGTFGGPGGASCGSSLGGGAEVSLNPQPFPPKFVLKPNGKGELTGLSLELSLNEGGLRCFYSAKPIKGTYNTDEEQPIVLGSKPPKFTEMEGSSPGCPKKLKGSANSWDVTAGAPAGGEFPLVFVG